MYRTTTFNFLKNFKQIGVHYGQIDLKNLKKSFMAMLSNYSYEENILNNSKKLVVNDIIDNGIRIFAQMVRNLLKTMQNSFEKDKRNLPEALLQRV